MGKLRARDGRPSIPEEAASEQKEPGVVEQLKEAIRQDGRSLNKIGKACGVSADQLSRFMRDKRDLTFQTVERICNELGLRLTSQRQSTGQSEPAPKKNK
jgi:transcriptional regulator with XRE-family HTH domain